MVLGHLFELSTILKLQSINTLSTSGINKDNPCGSNNICAWTDGLFANHLLNCHLSIISPTPGINKNYPCGITKKRNHQTHQSLDWLVHCLNDSLVDWWQNFLILFFTLAFNLCIQHQPINSSMPFNNTFVTPYYISLYDRIHSVRTSCSFHYICVETLAVTKIVFLSQNSQHSSCTIHANWYFARTGSNTVALSPFLLGAILPNVRRILTPAG